MDDDDDLPVVVLDMDLVLRGVPVAVAVLDAAAVVVGAIDCCRFFAISFCLICSAYFLIFASSSAFRFFDLFSSVLALLSVPVPVPAAAATLPVLARGFPAGGCVPVGTLFGGMIARFDVFFLFVV